MHVAWADVEAYAAWAGKAMPSEAEWERAARGGLEDAEYAWGDELTPGGKHMANVWQGEFPLRNEVLDGYEYTAPVRSFPPNGWGLFEMTGNVWEWTADWYQDHGAIAHACCTVDKPRGRRPRGQHRRCRPGARPPQGDEGWLAPVRAELLPALSPRGAHGAGRRHVDVASRLPLRRASVSVLAGARRGPAEIRLRGGRPPG